MYCVQRTNIQNLKAIHNSLRCYNIFFAIVFKERIYKIWKQFTTQAKLNYVNSHCVQRTNIQNLKAIHNTTPFFSLRAHIVFKERIYKIWKQFTTFQLFYFFIVLLCSKNEYTKSESNSQLISNYYIFILNCVQRTNM